MNHSIFRTIARNVLLLAVLAAVAGFLWLLYVPLEYVVMVTLAVALVVKADDYRLRRARRRAAQVEPVVA